MFERGGKVRVVLIPLATGMVVSALLLLGLLENFELVTVDWRYPYLREHRPAPLVIAAIDQNSLKEVGIWPWTRTLYASLIRKLTDEKALALLVDIDFSSRGQDTAGDRSMGKAMDDSLPVVLAMHMETKVNDLGLKVLNASLPFSDLQTAAAGIGSIRFEVDTDGTVRRAPPVIEFGDRVFMPLSYLGARFLVPGIAYHPPEGAMIHFTGSTFSRIPLISFTDILNGNYDKDIFRGKIVLLGATSQDLRDFWRCPLGIKPGVYFHAAGLETIINGSWVVREGKTTTLILVLATAMLLGALLGRQGWKEGAATLAVFLIAVTAAAIILVKMNFMIQVVPIYLVGLLQYPVQVTLHARKTEEVLDLEKKRTDAILRMSELEDAEETGQQPYVVPLVLLRQVLGLEAVRLYLLERDAGQSLRQDAVIGDADITGEDAFLREIIQSGELITTRGENHGGAHVYIPIKTVRTLMGVLFVAGPSEFQATENDLRMLLSYATQTAYFLESRELAEQMKEEEKVRTNLARYLSPQIVEQVIQNKVEVNLGGDRRIVTALFSDIRQFTTLSERMPPDRLVAVLNEYFNEMAHIIFQYQGSLDKYIGDALIAVFGSLIEIENPVRNAVQCAVEMMKLMPLLNSKWERKFDGFRMEIGIGINTGDVFLGNIGSMERMEFTVIGDAVNVASRFSDKAAPGQILLTQASADLYDGPGSLNELEEITVKGKSEGLRVYEVRY